MTGRGVLRSKGKQIKIAKLRLDSESGNCFYFSIDNRRVSEEKRIAVFGERGEEGNWHRVSRRPGDREIRDIHTEDHIPSRGWVSLLSGRRRGKKGLFIAVLYRDMYMCMRNFKEVHDKNLCLGLLRTQKRTTYNGRKTLTAIWLFHHRTSKEIL